jgi:zinc transport system substrate-binding protein
VPDEAQMESLKKVLATHPAKWMVWEGKPAAESVEKLKVLGINSVVFNPCANVPEKGNWLDVMKDNLKAMNEVTALKGDK